MQKPKREHKTRKKKQPKSQQYLSYRECKPIWKFSKFDRTHSKWGSNSGKWDKVIDELSGYEQMLWKDIETATGGKSKGTNSHFEPISRMCKDAQKRISSMALNNVGGGIEELFSLRITAKHRLYGILEEDGAFYVIWNDVDHEVWPVG